MSATDRFFRPFGGTSPAPPVADPASAPLVGLPTPAPARRRADRTPVTRDEPVEETPFLRPSRRTRVRRRGPLGRTILLLQSVGVSLAAVIALWAGYARVMASDRLKVVNVEVGGANFLSEGEVRELLGPAVGENILALDIEELKARLRASPWVAEATVTRTLPDTLRVDIRERVPLALAELERLYLMDGDGALIEMFGPRTAGFDLPIVRGLTGTDQATRRDRAERAGALLRDLGEVASEVSEVSVDEEGDLRVILRGAGEVLRLGPPPYRKRFLTFLGLRKELHERVPDAEYFDLRFRDRIYARDREGARSTPTTLAPAPIEEPEAIEPFDAGELPPVIGGGGR